MASESFSVSLQRDSDSPLVRLSPWQPFLESILVYEVQKYTPGQKYPTVEKKQLFCKDKDCGYFPVGLLKRVYLELDKRGFDIKATDGRDRKRFFPEPDWSVVGDLRSGQREVLEAIVKADTGLIVCATGFGKTHIIGLLTVMFPKSNFLIIAPGIAETENIYNRIKKLTPDVGMLGGHGDGNADARVVVSTSRSFLKADMTRFEFFLFDEAHGCGNNGVTQDILDNVRGSRMFGFTASPSGRSDKADRVVEALFGQPLVNFTYQDSQEAGNVTPIEVHVYDIPGQVAESKSPYGNAMTQNKRRFYWRNSLRNETIKAVARTVPDNEQVLIMVDTVEHLIILGSLLPEFALICGDNHDLEKEARCLKINLQNRLGDSKDSYARLVDEFSTGKLKKAISTYRWKQAVDFPQLSVLIRAEGSRSSILSTQVPGRLSRLCPGKTRGLLVDFSDGFNKMAKSKADARIRSYKSKGWEIVHRGEFTESSC